MDSKFAILRRGPNYNTTDGIGYNTLEQAAADGAVVMAYGYFPPPFPLPLLSELTLPSSELHEADEKGSTFLNKIINFLGVGFALYGVASVYEMVSTGDPIIKHMVKCKYCRKRISVKVSPFPLCLSSLPLCLSFLLSSLPKRPGEKDRKRKAILGFLSNAARKKIERKKNESVGC